ncbi:MAG: creatininase family protein [Bacteroidota bacterium]
MRESLTWGAYERLRPDQIEHIRAQTPLALVPWGALEWHSYHLPIGHDSLKAHALCHRLAERTGGVVLPPVYAATDTIKPFKGFPHSIEHAEALVEQLAVSLMRQLIEEQFRVVVVVTGHAGGAHVDALKRAAETVQDEHPECIVRAFPDFEHCDPEVLPANHAAFGETALQLALDPGPVDLARLPAGDPPTLDDDGVWGDDPRTATPEAGERLVQHFVDRTAAAIDSWITQLANRPTTQP